MKPVFFEMEIYNGFAKVYDLFMQDIPYDDWAGYIKQIWESFGHNPTLVLDLACGTGNITTRFAKMGYNMIGIDASPEMLMMAKNKPTQSTHDILYLCQDMCEFELYGTVDAIVCICDSINYILETDRLNDLFLCVKNYLNPDGIFIFDINTEQRFKNMSSDGVFSDIRENAAYILECFYDEDEKINEYSATFFVKDETSKRYDRYDETHYEKAYSLEEIKNAIETCGLKIAGIYDEMTLSPPKTDSQRVFFAVKK